MVENFYGYPLEDREKEPTGEAQTPDKAREEPLKQIGGKPLPPKQPPTPGKKF
jgi:hypothetical protein